MNKNVLMQDKIDLSALNQLKTNWKWYLVLGIGLIIFGSLAAIFSIISTLVSVIYLGSFIIVLGFFEGAKSFKINKWSSFFLHLFLSILYIVGGFFILLNPTVNALSLTLLLAIFFIVAGILRIIFSFSSNVPHKTWIFLNGILTLILGILIWRQWPYSGLWAIGTLVGIDAIFTGWTWIMLSLEAKNIKIENHPI